MCIVAALMWGAFLLAAVAVAVVASSIAAFVTVRQGGRAHLFWICPLAGNAPILIYWVCMAALAAKSGAAAGVWVASLVVAVVPTFLAATVAGVSVAAFTALITSRRRKAQGFPVLPAGTAIPTQPPPDEPV